MATFMSRPVRLACVTAGWVLSSVADRTIVISAIVSATRCRMERNTRFSFHQRSTVDGDMGDRTVRGQHVYDALGSLVQPAPSFRQNFSPLKVTPRIIVRCVKKKRTTGGIVRIKE